jgi:aminoglycoside 3-N-acetyltransferase
MTQESSVPHVAAGDITAGLGRLGITPDAGLIVHSSLSSFGRVDGGAQTVIDALKEVVTTEGTLLMPSFNHGAAFGKKGEGHYDPRTTPTTNGAIVDLFWRQAQTYRSLNPTHAFAAWGKHAQRYTENHHRALTMGPGSPLGLLQADGGSCLLLGVGYGANTFHHTVEMTMQVPCLGQRTESYPVIAADGQTVHARTWSWRDGSCPFTDGNRYGERMAARGWQRETTIGASRILTFRLEDCFEVVAEMLRDGTDEFPPCSGCSIRPRVAEETVPTDWDLAGKVLSPDSAAWGY